MKAFVDKIIAAGNTNATIYTYPGEGKPCCDMGSTNVGQKPGARWLARLVRFLAFQIYRGCSVTLKAYAFTNEASDSHCKSD